MASLLLGCTRAHTAEIKTNRTFARAFEAYDDFVTRAVHCFLKEETNWHVPAPKGAGKRGEFGDMWRAQADKNARVRERASCLSERERGREEAAAARANNGHATCTTN